ncbi:MAG TPA: ATP-binding protein, partial [Anaeromyxobacteraceae bacterium]|nr:ATP-binding protein [Anaeromyxobacteraceae bacterium]
LSRLDEDRLKPVIREVEPTAIVRRAVGRVTPAAEGKRVRVETEHDPALPNIETDASRVEQILVNLLGNAIRHTPEGQAVHVRARARGAWLVIEVEDEGPGIPAEDVERVFDIYVTKAGEEARGTGLGLPLSRRLARLLGGELRADPGVGRGARFVLELPAVLEAQRPEATGGGEGYFMKT